MSNPYSHDFHVRIYYPHTDAGGVVYHGQYLAFADMARTELLRMMGVNLHDVYQETGALILVKSAGVNYKQPARLDDELIVRTTVDTIKGASAKLSQHFYKKLPHQETDTVLMASVQVHLACVGEGYLPVRWPIGVKNALNEFCK